MRVYSNSSPRDMIRNAFYNNLSGVTEVSIASPFFSYIGLVEEVLKANCFVRLIVKLGPATSPDALQRLFNQKNIHIRYFTSSAFHSKLYIFGDKASLVGSANFTQAGMNSNREICVEIPREDEAFDNLVMLFQSYWNQAAALTPEVLNKYTTIFAAYTTNVESTLENKIKDQFGDVVPGEGIEVGKPKLSKERVFLVDYQRTYQEFLTAYNEVREVYREDGRRQQPEHFVPLRIEIDQFFSFIRERFTKGESYLGEPLRSGDDRKIFLKSKLNDWFNQRWNYLDEHIPDNIPRVQRLSTKDAIEKATFDDLVDALDVCHSFHDRLRFFPGGHDTHIKEFKDSNDLRQVKKVLLYLLHGNDDNVTRMGNCIFDPEYKLNQFGRSAVQELFGWVNKEEIPICNGRTVKALRYLGYSVAIFA